MRKKKVNLVIKCLKINSEFQNHKLILSYIFSITSKNKNIGKHGNQLGRVSNWNTHWES